MISDSHDAWIVTDQAHTGATRRLTPQRTATDGLRRLFGLHADYTNATIRHTLTLWLLMLMLFLAVAWLLTAAGYAPSPDALPAAGRLA